MASPKAKLVPPRIGTKRSKRATMGPVVADVADRMGLHFHPWQRHRADVSGEMSGGRLVANTTLTMAGRQTGKTTAVTADVATRCLAPDLPELAKLAGHPIGRQHVAFTAQDRIGALGRWYEHVEMICSSELNAYVDRVVRKNGEECLWWRNGSRYSVVTPSRTGARGLSLDAVVIDEALAHEPWLLEVLAPTMAQRDGASASFGAQLIIVSNAGDERAELLNQQRELGRRAVAENDRSYVLLEWSCADDDDVLEPEVWKRTIPTLDQPDGLASAWLMRQAEVIGTDAFAREYLCRMVPSAARQVIDLDRWMALPYVTAAGDIVLGVEVSLDRQHAVIVAAGQAGGVFGIELLDESFGMEWFPERVASMAGQHRRVVIDKFGPASSLVPALRQLDVDVVEVGSRELADASALLIDLMESGRLGHTGDARLADSVMGLSRRARGDRWAFDRHQGRPGAIIAGALAAWKAQEQSLQTNVW